MKKVVIVLEPKKFSGKRDKLKEAKLQLEEESKEELVSKVVEEKESLSDDIVPEEITLEKNDEFLDIFSVNGDEDITTIDSVKDIFLDDDEGEIGFNLDTQVSDDKKVKEVIELTDLKLNASDYSNMNIPTEIFIEDPPQEKMPDLFSVTDPFLDDNEFELEDVSTKDSLKGMMPSLGSIGTVRPNNALSKIEDVVKESEDVILPNLGLVDTTKVDVPIVSENYIN